METVLLSCLFAAIASSVAGAPTYPESEEAQIRQYPEEYQYLRPTRSQYTPQYLTPCAAAAAAAAAGNSLHVPGFASPYNLNVPSYGGAQFGHSGLHYRSVDEQMAEPEMLALSDMEQFHHGNPMMMDTAMARSAYGQPISSVGAGFSVNGPMLASGGGPAYGIFPNSNVGGCNVPLLFSCSPSISSGRLVNSGSQNSLNSQLSSIVPLGSGNSYRLVEQNHHNIPESGEELPEHHLEAVHQTGHAVQSHR